VDARRCAVDRSSIRHVDLQRAGVAVDRLGGLLAARQVARTDQDGEILRGQILGDLETDPLIGPGDEGDGFVLHDNLRVVPSACQHRPVALVWVQVERRSVCIRNNVPFGKRRSL
jgi:hypothetical protein